MATCYHLPDGAADSCGPILLPTPGKVKMPLSLPFTT